MTPEVARADQQVPVQAVEDRGPPGGELREQRSFAFVANPRGPTDEPEQLSGQERKHALEQRRLRFGVFQRGAPRLRCVSCRAMGETARIEIDGKSYEFPIIDGLGGRARHRHLEAARPDRA